jgi:hypothetical protein
MTNPRIFEENVKAGFSEPLPDYIGYLVAAEENNCSPWDFFEGFEHSPPRMFWAAAGMIMAGAKSDAQEKQRASAEAKSKSAASRNKR